MIDITINKNCLVLYKNNPAQIKHVGNKLEIELQTGRRLKVRAKDVIILHPNPIADLNIPQPPQGEVYEAWDLLAGSVTDLAELAELVYGEYTPVTAWATWKLVDERLYFSGTPDSITVYSKEKVEQEKNARKEKIEREQAWQAFLGRLEARQVEPQDADYLREVEDIALRRGTKSRILRLLGLAEKAEVAHALLLELRHWDATVNPYPHRFSINMNPPDIELPNLQNEVRLDLTHLPAFAIDGKDSKDPDDAISLDGNRLWVHIADVACLVLPDSPADLEARGRGTNLYLPKKVVHMLPPKATELLGLGLNDISPALSFGLDVNDEGYITNVEVVLSKIRVTRLTYEEAQERLDEEPFRSLCRLTRAHRAVRYQQGAISIELPEVKIKVKNGKVSIYPMLPLESRELVTESMLMTGYAVAKFAIEQNIPLPFTTQPPPQINLESLPDGLAGMYKTRRSMKRSQIRGTPSSHGGLGLEIYAQATSPLRRYLDLVIHQQLRAYLLGRPVMESQQVLELVGATESMQVSIRQVERLSQKHWTLVYLMQHPTWRGIGILVERRDLRGVVIIPELDLEFTIHLRDQLPLNCEIPLKLNKVNLTELSVSFSIMED